MYAFVPLGVGIRIFSVLRRAASAEFRSLGGTDRRTRARTTLRTLTPDTSVEDIRRALDEELQGHHSDSVLVGVGARELLPKRQAWSPGAVSAANCSARPQPSFAASVEAAGPRRWTSLGSAQLAVGVRRIGSPVQRSRGRMEDSPGSRMPGGIPLNHRDDAGRKEKASRGPKARASLAMGLRQARGGRPDAHAFDAEWRAAAVCVIPAAPLGPKGPPPAAGPSVETAARRAGSIPSVGQSQHPARNAAVTGSAPQRRHADESQAVAQSGLLRGRTIRIGGARKRHPTLLAALSTWPGCSVGVFRVLSCCTWMGRPTFIQSTARTFSQMTWRRCSSISAAYLWKPRCGTGS